MSAGEALAPRAVHALTAAGLTVATAESLTAGLAAATLADVPGASATLQGGVVAYQNHVKADVLGVDRGLLAECGAVDPAVARQMAAGARRLAGADVGVSTTGVAGPEPHQGRSVGTVYLGLAVPRALAERAGDLADGGWTPVDGDDDARATSVELHLDGDRDAIRRGTVERVLALLLGLGEAARAR